MKLCIRPIYYFLSFFCVFLLFTAYILEHYFDLIPCSLCIIDRAIVVILFLFYTFAIWHNPAKIGQRIYAIVGFCLSLMGIAMTARHLWLIHLNQESVPDCSPGWEYLIQTLPLNEALSAILMGSKECTQNMSYFLGLSLPAWTMIGFILLALGSLLPLLGSFRQKKG